MTKKAFTIIEVLGAIVILGIAMVPVIGLIQSTLVISQKQEWETKVLYLAQQRLEEEIELLRDDFLKAEPPGGLLEGNYRFIIQYFQDQTMDAIPLPIPLDQLKIVQVTVWYDEDASGEPPDAGETRVILSTKLARR